MNPNDQLPITQGFLRDALRGFATKDDLRGFATKDDLRGFATKDDLRAIVDDIRVDLRELVRPLQIAVAQHTGELAELRGGIGHVRANMVTRDEFHHRMDAFAGRVVDEDYRAAKSRTRLDEHEDRITALEKRSS